MNVSVSPVLPSIAAAAPALQLGQGLLTWPFDAARWSYAAGVQAGLFPRSMLVSRDVERLLASMESASLGVLARRV